jgi:hypothetical protein
MEGIISLWSRGRMAKLFVVIAVVLLGASIFGALALVVQSQSPDDPADGITVAAPSPSPTAAPTPTAAPVLHGSSMLAPLFAAASLPARTSASDATSAVLRCRAKQIEGAQRSGVAPTLQADVHCFDSAAQARAAGYQRASE